MDMTESGRQAARHIWFHWGKPTYVQPDDLMTIEFADGALLEYERLQEEAPGVMHVMADGAQKGAQQLNLDDYHGVMEVLQNADDLLATEVVVCIRKNSECNELLIVHNGEPVAVQHVLAMTYAFISTKVEDSRQKGKFGVGLKTLGRIADRMEVHSNTYSFAIENQRIRKIPPCEPISGIFQPGKRSTLLRLRLFNTFDPEEFIGWFTSLDASILLFLDTVAAFRFLSDDGLAAAEHLLDKDQSTQKWTMHNGKSDFEITSCLCRDRASAKEWTRFYVEVDVPKKISRSHKKTGDLTRLGLALAKESGQQKIYAGLPTYIKSSLPFSLDAQFDPDTSREALLTTEWNKWLVSEVAEFLASVVISLFVHSPERAWEMIPLAEEMDFENPNLESTVRESFKQALARIKRDARIKIQGNDVLLSDLSYEVEALEGLLGDSDYPLLSNGKHGLPFQVRGECKRWRNVLKELDCCREITVADAFNLFSNNTICSGKTPKWFVDFLLAAIAASTLAPIFTFPCLLLESGSRIQAQEPGNQTVMLVRQDRLSTLSHFTLSRTLHPVYFSSQEKWQVLAEFFQSKTNYTEETNPLDLLTSFANRHEESPLELKDNELAEVKSLFDSCSHDAPHGLGERLGRSILLDAHQWWRGKKVRCKARISDCFLPAGIVKDKAGQWFVAAGKTPGLTWISSRYSLLLRGHKKNIAGRADESIRKAPGSGRFFRALGAEIAPRITRLTERRVLPSLLPRLQREAIGKLSPSPSHLENDYLSQDLEAVVKNICSSRKKGERRDRGVALFDAISFSWERLYSGTEECLTTYHHYLWKYPGRVPSSWIANLAGSDWLMNQKNVPKAPMDLVIRTSATRAIYGDAPNLFAAVLGEDHCDTAFPMAMRMETNPRASGIIEQIQRIKDGEDAFEFVRLQQLYAALAEIGKRLKFPAVLSSLFDDITVAMLRSSFSNGGSKGLLYVDGTWAIPEKVLWGRNIFHGHRLFVQSSKKLDPLWRALGLRQPEFEDCLAVLRELAKRPLEKRDEAALIDTYRHINSQIGTLTPTARRRLGELPLWCHGKWVKERPIFWANSEDVAKNLADTVPMWSPPCSFIGMTALLDSLKVRVIDPREFTLRGTSAFGEIFGEQERPRFMRTVAALEEYFARIDDQLYRSLQVDWETLKQAPIHICEHLAIEWTYPGMLPFRSDVRAHVTTNPLSFYFRSIDDMGEKDAGGKVIAECFLPESCREQVAVTWVWKWQEAVKVQSPVLSLAKDQEEDQNDQVLEAAKKSKGKTSQYERNDPTMNKSQPAEVTRVERKLKDFILLDTASITSVNGGAEAGGYKEPANRGLKKEPPQAPTAGSPSPGALQGTHSVVTYTTEELEEKALRCLDHVLKHGELGELKDFRKFRGIGADAAIDLKKFFEIKASAREMPDRVELTLNELDRAKISADSFYLVVVSGLEEGYETILQIYSNPLHNLDWYPSRSLVVSGLKSKHAIQVKLNVDSISV